VGSGRKLDQLTDVDAVKEDDDDDDGEPVAATGVDRTEAAPAGAARYGDCGEAAEASGDVSNSPTAPPLSRRATE